MDKYKEIAECAYYIWERKGCPEGNALKCWLEAETELKAAAIVREHMKGKPKVAPVHYVHHRKVA